MKKDRALKNAKDLIEQQRRIFNQQEPNLDILGDINDLERDFFDQENNDSEYNYMSEISDFKNNFLDQMTSKKSKIKK